jgi:hypothetical protein
MYYVHQKTIYERKIFFLKRFGEYFSKGIFFLLSIIRSIFAQCRREKLKLCDVLRLRKHAGNRIRSTSEKCVNIFLLNCCYQKKSPLASEKIGERKRITKTYRTAI